MVNTKIVFCSVAIFAIELFDEDFKIIFSDFMEFELPSNAMGK